MRYNKGCKPCTTIKSPDSPLVISLDAEVTGWEVLDLVDAESIFHIGVGSRTNLFRLVVLKPLGVYNFFAEVNF